MNIGWSLHTQRQLPREILSPSNQNIPCNICSHADLFAICVVRNEHDMNNTICGWCVLIRWIKNIFFIFFTTDLFLIQSFFINDNSVHSSYIFSCDQVALWMVQSVRLSVCPSVRPSVRLSVTPFFHHVPIIVSSWNFQELLPMRKVTSMQKVKIRGQRSRSQRSTPNLIVSGL